MDHDPSHKNQGTKTPHIGGVQDPGFRIPGSGSRVQDPGFNINGSPPSDHPPLI